MDKRKGCGPTGRWDWFHIKQTESAAERSNMMKFPLKDTGGSDRAANNLGKGQHLPSSHSDSERFKSAESNQTTQLFLQKLKTSHRIANRGN